MALSKQVIDERMTELRNLRKLYAAQKEQNNTLRAENKQLKARIKELEAENQQLRGEVTDIKYQLSELQTLIFKKKRKAKETLADDTDDDDTPKPPRNAASYRRPIPKDSEVTKVIRHDFPKDKNGNLRFRTYYVEDIPLDIQKIVEKHEVAQYYDHNRRVWVSAAPLPFARVTLGDNIRVLITTLVTVNRLSFSQTRTLLETLFHIHISDGEITKILQSEAARLQPTADAIRENLRAENSYHLDESRYDVNGETHYVWSMTGGDSGRSAYQLGVSRGKGNAEDLRGDSIGVLISDDYGAYRYLAAHHQLCWAHLLRKFRDLTRHDGFTDEQRDTIQTTYREIKAIYRDVRAATKTSDPPRQKAALTTRLQTVAVINTADPTPVNRLKITLQRNVSKYLTCLSFPDIALTNNAAERALRHVVLKRKISFGVRSHTGAKTLSTLFTVLLSLNREPATYFEKYRELRRV